MTAIIAAVGLKALAYTATGIAAVFGLLFIGHTAKSSGAADQRAADAQKGKDDEVAATKARSDVDALGDAAVDDRLRGFQRK